jgi:hypothetical protein
VSYLDNSPFTSWASVARAIQRPETAAYTTRQDQAAALAMAEIDGPAGDLLLRLAVIERHERRVATATAVALAAAEAEGYDLEDQAPHAWSILAADMIGVGGHVGLTGAATLRVPALRACGSGRKQAGDGGAWDAAIAAAMASVGGSNRWVPGGDTVSIRSADGSQYSVCPNLVPMEWRRAILGLGLVHSLNLAAWAGFDRLHLYEAGGPAEWAVAYNRSVALVDGTILGAHDDAPRYGFVVVFKWRGLAASQQEYEWYYQRPVAELRAAELSGRVVELGPDEGTVATVCGLGGEVAS